MNEYGLTPKGPNIKRLDVIIEEIHAELTAKWGVNTKQNPNSFLNNLITDFADKIAELWEFGEDVYFSQYPSSAEGTSLDNAAQYGGSTRETASKSYYPIHCTGTDGTKLKVGTTISSKTNPTTYLTLTEEREISRAAFNKAKIRVASNLSNAVYTVAINGSVFSYTSQNSVTNDILEGIASSIIADGFTATVKPDDETVVIEANDLTSTNSLVLSENLTTESVTTIIIFGTQETGDIIVPDEVITNIVKADAGLFSVINLTGYTAGNDEESDTEFRQSYIDKIFNRSSMMLESIRSSILNNVQGVVSVAPYENDTNEVDEHGRPPHSIEIVVDGGDSSEIAQQILAKKAGGISTFGDTTVILPGAYDEDIPIRFSRPSVVYTWFHLGITLSKSDSLPQNYVDLLRKVIIDNMREIESGSDVIPQQFMSSLYEACSGISYIDIKVFSSTSDSDHPTEYPDRTVSVMARQRAYTSEEMIEVEIDG